MEVRIFTEDEGETVVIQIIDHKHRAMMSERIPRKVFVKAIEPLLEKPAPKGVPIH